MTVTADAERELAEIAPHALRAAGDTDLIDGRRPRWVVEPGTPEMMAACLAWASRHSQSVVIRGGGTKLVDGLETQLHLGATALYSGIARARLQGRA